MDGGKFAISFGHCYYRVPWDVVDLLPCYNNLLSEDRRPVKRDGEQEREPGQMYSLKTCNSKICQICQIFWDLSTLHYSWTCLVFLCGVQWIKKEGRWLKHLSGNWFAVNVLWNYWNNWCLGPTGLLKDPRLYVDVKVIFSKWPAFLSQHQLLVHQKPLQASRWLLCPMTKWKCRMGKARSNQMQKREAGSAGETSRRRGTPSSRGNPFSQIQGVFF